MPTLIFLLLFYSISIFHGYPKAFSWGGEGGVALYLAFLIITIPSLLFPINHHPSPLHLNHAHCIILLHGFIFFPFVGKKDTSATTYDIDVATQELASISPIVATQEPIVEASLLPHKNQQ